MTGGDGVDHGRRPADDVAGGEHTPQRCHRGLGVRLQQTAIGDAVGKFRRYEVELDLLPDGGEDAVGKQLELTARQRDRTAPTARAVCST